MGRTAPDAGEGGPPVTPFQRAVFQILAILPTLCAVGLPLFYWILNRKENRP